MKTTNQQFNYFKERVNYWLKEFMINDFNIRFAHELMKSKFNAKIIRRSRSVAVILNKEWQSIYTPLNDYELDRTAKHEVIHIMISKIVDFNSENTDEKDEKFLRELGEELTNKLNNLIKE